MLVQSFHLTKVLNEKNLLIDLINKLLNDLLSQTKHLGRGNSIFHCKDSPSISVEDYLKRIAKFANCSNSVFVMSLIYIDRLQEYIEGFIINHHCVHRLLICTVMVAAKFIDDAYYKNEYYAKIGGISKLEINALELQLVKNLNYNLYITESQFSIYLEKLEAYIDLNCPLRAL